MRFGADDFGLGVVAVRRSTANVQESDRAIVKLQHRHAGLGVAVLGKLGVLEVGARGVNLGNLTAEEPAHQVNVVRSRVNEDTARGLGELDAALDQCFRVKAGSLYQIRLADAACVDLCLCIRIGRIVAAHKAKEEDLVRVTFNSSLSALALLERAAERLVGENVLACIERVLDHPAVLRRGGDDNDSFDVCLVNHFLVVRGGVLYLEVVLRPVQLLLLERAGSDQLAAGNLEREILRVYRTETAQTDDANFDFLHVCSPFYRADFLSTAIERLPVSLSYQFYHCVDANARKNDQIRAFFIR